jgi:phosphatidylglycerol---prolipoprotein diacylglyceryl transferase
MSFPINLNLGPVSLNLHLIFETLSFFIGFRYFLYLRRNHEDLINSSDRVWILIGAALGAFLFSRLVGGLENPVEFFSFKHSMIYYYGNKTILGGLLGGLLCTEITKKILKVKYSSGDLYVYPLVLAIIIGRIGCFTAGVNEQTYGIKTSLPWGMDLGDGFLRHPVALYEILFLILLWIGLQNLEKKYVLANGIRFQFFMIAYLLFRLVIDFIKPGFRYSVGLTTIQIFSILGLVYYSNTISKTFLNFSLLARKNEDVNREINIRK